MPKVSVVCSSREHPIFPVMEAWSFRNGAGLFERIADAPDSDFLFLVSCGEIASKQARSRFRHCLVLHASDLPDGRGWSPHVWHILNGVEELTVSLLSADDPVDSGAIWHQKRIPLNGTELCDEVNDRLFAAEVELMDWALTNCDHTAPVDQDGEPSYFRQRTPEDSHVSPEQTLAEIFDLLRVADPVRYPAFFEHRGQKYALDLRKVA